jgi:hypothetical protein
MKSRLRSVAGAYWRSSLIKLIRLENFGHRVADASIDVASVQRAPSATRALPSHPPPDGKRALFPAIFPDQLAPIVRNGGDGRSASSPRRARACRGRRDMAEPQPDALMQAHPIELAMRATASRGRRRGEHCDEKRRASCWSVQAIPQRPSGSPAFCRQAYWN